jgi:hypothetical protein
MFGVQNPVISGTGKAMSFTVVSSEISHVLQQLVKLN